MPLAGLHGLRVPLTCFQRARNRPASHPQQQCEIGRVGGLMEYQTRHTSARCTVGELSGSRDRDSQRRGLDLARLEAP